MQSYKLPDGSSVEGQEIDFATVDEEWNTYALKDGTRLRLKTVVLKVIRTESFNPEGEPVYLVKSNNMVDVQVAEHLRKEGP